MQALGHVAMSLIVATPVIYCRYHYPAFLAADALSVEKMIWLVCGFSILPDIELLFIDTKDKDYRGYACHSLVTVCAVFLFMLFAYTLTAFGILPDFNFFTPFTCILAPLAVFVHIMGDAMSKNGVPLLWPKTNWLFPFVGGYEGFDGWTFDIVAMIVAFFIATQAFGYSPAMFRAKVFIQKVKDSLIMEKMEFK